MAIRPFVDFLREQRGGATQEELAEALNELVAAVERTRKKGTLTFTVEVSPVAKEMSGQVLVHDSVKLKLPNPKRSATLFFSTPENNLSRIDPRQRDLDLKTVEIVAPTMKPIEGVANA